MWWRSVLSQDSHGVQLYHLDPPPLPSYAAMKGQSNYRISVIDIGLSADCPINVHK
jgi:hypothetical protein